jgi:hypothetical protein
VCCCPSKGSDDSSRDQSTYYSSLEDRQSCSSFSPSVRTLSFSPGSASVNDVSSAVVKICGNISIDMLGASNLPPDNRARVMASYRSCSVSELTTLFMPLSKNSTEDLLVFLDQVWDFVKQANESVLAKAVTLPDINYSGEDSALGFYPGPGAKRAGQYERLFTIFIRHYSGMSLKNIMSILYCVLSIEESACAESNEQCLFYFYNALFSADSLHECLSQDVIPNHFALFPILRQSNNGASEYCEKKELYRKLK